MDARGNAGHTFLTALAVAIMGLDALGHRVAFMAELDNCITWGIEHDAKQGYNTEAHVREIRQLLGDKLVDVDIIDAAS